VSEVGPVSRRKSNSSMPVPSALHCIAVLLARLCVWEGGGKGGESVGVNTRLSQQEAG
jgi:hypothetical protein